MQGHTLSGVAQFVLPPLVSGLCVAAFLTRFVPRQFAKRQQRWIGLAMTSGIALCVIAVCVQTAPEPRADEEKASVAVAGGTRRTDLADIEREQRSIQNQLWAASQLVVSYFSTVLIAFPLQRDEDAPDATAARLLLSARSLSGPCLLLGAAIVHVGSLRYPTPHKTKAVTDGAGEDEEMRIPRSYLQNTLEQLMLHSLASLAMAATLPPDALHVVPAMSVFWVAGRLVFRFSYAKLPVLRAYGFAMTLGPSMASLLFCTANAVKDLVTGLSRKQMML